MYIGFFRKIPAPRRAVAECFAMNDYYNVNQWEGKTVCFLGDSITDGVGVGAGERYFDLMDGMIGIKSVGYGVNGAQFINLIDQINR